MTPRAAAMGQAYVGLADDVEAVFYNPAGMFQISERKIMASYINYFVDFLRFL